MPSPSPGRFRQADAIFDAALDLEPDERLAFIDRACQGNPTLRTTVMGLLRALERSSDFLAEPAVEVARPLLHTAPDASGQEESTPPPERVGPYRVISELGRGGMGVVYLASREDDPSGELVALKTLRGGALATGTLLRRFLSERQILASIKHPFIARLHESGITPAGEPYFAMAYSSRGSLAERVETGALPAAEALRVARQLAEALSAAHAVGVIHRDIKPANVLFNAAGDVQLTDFGIAKLLDQDSTQSGAILGTPAYLAPEQIRSRTVDHRADLWAVGVTLYQMLAGRRPFEGDSYAAVLQVVLAEEPSPLGQVAAVPPALTALVHHLLRKEPGDRPQTAVDVVRALEAIEADPTAPYVPVEEVQADRHAPAPGATRAAVAILPPGDIGGSPVSRRETATLAPPARRRWVAVLALASLALATALVALWWPGTKARSPLLAVGAILEPGPRSDDPAKAAPAVRGLLVTQLSRLSGVEVLSQSRMIEVLARTGGSLGVAAEALAAARLAGATELLEGDLGSIPGAGYTLDIRRIDVRSGSERDRVSLRAPDLETLVSQATSWVAQAHGTVPPPATTGGLTSRSAVAQRRYESGLEAYYRGAMSEAMRDYLAALEADSTFLAPLYELPNVWSGPGWEGMVARLGRAARAAGGAPELERLRMRVRWAIVTFDPSLLAVAESLATRYPSEPEAQFAFGSALLWSGDFLGAIPWFRRTVAADSALARYPTAATVPCQSCLARTYLAWAYSLADSGDAAVREVRAWRATDPGLRLALRLTEAGYLETLGRRDEMLAILRDSTDNAEIASSRLSLEIESAIRGGDFAEVSRLIESSRGSSDSSVTLVLQAWEVTAERTRGLPGSALAATRRVCDRDRALPWPRMAMEDECALARLSPLLELGNYGRAIRELRERLQERYPDSMGVPGLDARRRAWLLLHLGVALAAAGDTAALAAVADSLEWTGRRSGYGRDRLMHHHLRGLLLQARGQHEQAAAEFRQAIWSPNQGYPRTNLELAHELLRIGQPSAAVAALEPLLRGPLDGMGTYATQTEAHALLAEALDRAGDRAGAIVHAKWVESAWADAEPPVRARLRSLLQTLRVSAEKP